MEVYSQYLSSKALKKQEIFNLLKACGPRASVVSLIMVLVRRAYCNHAVNNRV